MESPLVTRYASKDIVSLFEPLSIAKEWRRVWIVLAECLHHLDSSLVTREQVTEMRVTRDAVDLSYIKIIEQETRHDVVAHIKAWGEMAPKAAPIIHLGATSAFVTDNAESAIQKQALVLIREQLVNVIRGLASFAQQQQGKPTLGYTHFQPAQPTTISKRVCLWLQELIDDCERISKLIFEFECRGAKGTTGTQASFLELLGSEARVIELDQMIATKLGFRKSVGLSGQTLTRKRDAQLADLLAGIAISLGKMGNDIRLLSHTNEMFEGFKKNQVGSSAMPYKRNPMKAERMCSLSRLVLHQRNSLADTAMVQWLERTLDDSSIRRIVIPEIFMATSAILRIAASLANCLQVNDEVRNARIKKFLPIMSVERIIVEAVKQGYERQAVHEQLMNLTRSLERFSEKMELFRHIPENAKLVKIIDEFQATPELLSGMASYQVDNFLKNNVESFLKKFIYIKTQREKLLV